MAYVVLQSSDVYAQLDRMLRTAEQYLVGLHTPVHKCVVKFSPKSIGIDKVPPTSNKMYFIGLVSCTDGWRLCFDCRDPDSSYDDFTPFDKTSVIGKIAIVHGLKKLEDAIVRIREFHKERAEEALRIATAFLKSKEAPPL
jgi:hypothetical protein